MTRHKAARRLLELSEALGALRYGAFRLSSGAMSGYYFDGRLLTLSAEGAAEVGRVFARMARECGADAVAGPALAAAPIVAAVAVTSHLEGAPISALIVRNEAKAHGAGKRIEGKTRPGMAVAVVDDTCTTGGSLLRAIDAVEAAGCHVVRVMCILDRREGGSDAIRRRGFEFLSLLESDAEGRVRVTPAERRADG